MKDYSMLLSGGVIVCICMSVVFNCPAHAQGSGDEIESLRRIAQQEVSQDEAKETSSKDITFKSGALSQQALNPELSISGDMYGYYSYEDNEHFSFNFRGLGMHLESYLDPYSRFKSAVEVGTEGAELGEAYFTRFGVLKGINLTLGKFRQQFGVVNRWHKHGLDQFDFPVPLRMIFGEGGLNQIGLSLEWTMPQLGKISQELILQVTNADNNRMFGNRTVGIPCVMARYKNYRDLSDDTYFELGLNGIIAINDDWEIFSGGSSYHSSANLAASVVGIDMTFFWEPAARMRYSNFTWRTECYFVRKNILSPDGSGQDVLKPWGAYTYLQNKVSLTLDFGIRADFFKPDTKTYADTGEFLSPLAVTRANPHCWQIGPYITWQQSPFVRYRLEYNHKVINYTGSVENCLMLQCIFAAGPHKHERY